MSFILDALKKLEQKKQHHTVPDILSIHSSPSQEQKKQAIWPYILVAALLINAVVLAAWLRPWDEGSQKIANRVSDTLEQKTPATEQEAAVADNHKEAASPSNAVEKTDTATTLSNDTPPVKADTDKAESNITVKTTQSHENTEQVKEEPSEELLTTRRLNMSGHELEELKNQIKADRSDADDIPAPGSANQVEIKIENPGDLISFSQLPQSVRTALPEITINAHIYSNNPESRLANINGSIVREGESVTKGLVVEEITMDGVILDFEGLRFSKGAF